MKTIRITDAEHSQLRRAVIGRITGLEELGQVEAEPAVINQFDESRVICESLLEKLGDNETVLTITRDQLELIAIVIAMLLPHIISTMNTLRATIGDNNPATIFLKERIDNINALLKDLREQSPPKPSMP